MKRRKRRTWRPAHQPTILEKPPDDRVPVPVHLESRRTVDLKQILLAGARGDRTPTLEVGGLSMYSFYALSLSQTGRARLYLLVGPDGEHWLTDQKLELGPGDGGALVANRYFRYAYVAVRPVPPAREVLVQVWLQGQV